MYLRTIQELRAIAEGVNPSGTFLHGRDLDASLSFGANMPLIHVLPFTTREEDFLDSEDVIICFWFQDSPDSTPEERENLISQAFELSSDFIGALKESPVLTIRAIEREPQYQTLSGTFSGYAVKVRLEAFDACDPLASFYGFTPIKEISRTDFDNLSNEQKAAPIFYLIDENS